MGDPERLSWANGNLMELFVLAPLIPELNVNVEEATEQAEKYAYEFRRVTEANSINLYSTRRQMARYRSFFVEVNEAMETAAQIADKVLTILPESQKY